MDEIMAAGRGGDGGSGGGGFGAAPGVFRAAAFHRLCRNILTRRCRHWRLHGCVASFSHIAAATGGCTAAQQHSHTSLPPLAAAFHRLRSSILTRRCRRWRLHGCVATFSHVAAATGGCTAVSQHSHTSLPPLAAARLCRNILTHRCRRCRRWRLQGAMGYRLCRRAPPRPPTRSHCRRPRPPRRTRWLSNRRRPDIHWPRR